MSFHEGNFKVAGEYRCYYVGCENVRDRKALYCSEQCRRDARAEIEQVKSNTKNDRDAATIAGRAEPCRDCPAAYCCSDEFGDVVCSCARKVAA